MFRWSNTKWMVFASGYAIANVTATWANSNPERSGVAKVKWRPALGSTAQKTLAVPQRSYSLSRRASRPGAAGEVGRTIGVQGDRLFIQTDYRLLRVIGPLVYLQNVFHLGDIIVIQVGHHPHFFP